MNRNILVVEDNSDDATLIGVAFHKAGFNHLLCVVTSPQEAINYLGGDGKYGNRERFPFPNLVLLDHQMPGDGCNVLQWVRQNPTLSTLPVVILTGSLNPGHESQARNAGVNGYYCKPPNFTAFVETIREISETWLPADLT